MSVSILLAGVLLGLSIAAPVGPMGMLVVSRTLSEGFWAGLAIGCGIAVGDGLYGALAASGFAALAQAALSFETPLRLLGGAVLIGLGLQSWRSADAPRAARSGGHQGLVSSFIVAVGLTLANPATIISFLAAFSALGLLAQQGGALELVAGVFVGSALWWLALCLALAVARVAITPIIMAWINRASAGVLCLFGLAALLRAI